jgi:transcription elongation factor GreA
VPTTDNYTEPIRLGSIVDVLYLDKGFRRELTVVAPQEANPFRGKMNVRSPLCKAILGRKRGEIVDLSAPGGRFRIQIMGVDNSAVPAEGELIEDS